VRVDWYDDTRTIISSNNLDLISNTAGVWTYSGLDITSPIQAVYAKVVVGRFNVNGSTDIQVDAIKLDRAVYIPSGVISLDDVTDGVTYARPKGDGLLSGYPKLDTVVDGALFRKVGVGYVDSSNRIVSIRNVVDNVDVAGSAVFRKTIDTFASVAGTISTPQFGAGVVDSNALGAGSVINAKLGDLSISSGKLQDSAVTTAKLNALAVDSSKLAAGAVITSKIAAGAVTNAELGDLSISSGKLQDSAVTNAKIGALAVDSAKIAAAAVITSKIDAGAVTSNELGALAVTEGKIASGAVTETKIGALAVTEGKLSALAVTNGKLADLSVSTGKLQELAVSTGKLADLAITEAKLGALSVTEGKIGALAISSGKLQDSAVIEAKLATGAVTNTKIGALAVDSAKLAAAAVTTAKIATGAVTSNELGAASVITAKIATGAVTSNELGAASVINAKLDLLSVATGNLQDTAITTAKIADLNITSGKVASQAIDWSKLDDGAPIMAWDEGRGSLLSGRVTLTNGGTLQTIEVNQGYTSWAVTSGTTDFYVETDIQFRTIKDQYVSITYRTGGTTGWAASSTMKVVNISNTAQTATATMYGDGLWHTAIFDISAFTGTGTVRFDPQDGGAAIGAGATFWVSNVAVGSIGVGPGGGHTLSSYRGSVGINVAKPTYQLETGGSTAQFPTLFSVNASSHATSRRAGMFLGDWLVGQDVSGNGTKDFFISNSSLGVPLVFQVSSTGTFNMFQPSSGSLLRMSGSSSPTVQIVNSTNAASTFPQLQVLNYGANGGFPAHQFYNSRGTEVVPVSSNSGDVLGATIYSGRVLAAFAEGARQEAVLTAAPGLTTLTTALRWYTSNASSSTVRARLSAAGRLYIGGDADAEELVEARTGSSAYGFLHSNGTIKLGSYISTTEAQFGTESNHDISFFTNNGAGRLRIMAAGDVRVPALAGVGNRAVYSDADGDLTNTSSDATLKRDIQSLDNVLPVVMKMNPVSFSWKDQERFGPYTEVGFLAQEMLELVPFVVGKNSDDTFTIDYPKLTAVLARAIQELKQQVDELAISRL
jgi:hypothetical protein